MNVIEVRNLQKTFKVAKRKPGFINAAKGFIKRDYTNVKALDDVSFNIKKGELVGYIGPNGAGKSTTVKILSGIMVPDQGQCNVLGLTPWKNRIEHVKRIGVVFGQRSQLWWDLPVIDSFELIKDIYKVDKNDYKKNKDELVEILNLTSYLETPVRQLSLGQRMRCELAASLLHSPPILFLDEPTIGLDAISKLAVRDFVKKINKERDVTVILTTHDMDDIEALCSRVLVIGKGKLLSDGSLEALREKVCKERRIKFKIKEPSENFKLLSIDNVSLISKERDQITLEFNPYKVDSSKLINILSQNYSIGDIFIENLPIDHIIAKLYGELKI